MNQLFLDVESFPDYFLALFVDAEGRSKAFEHYEGHPLDTAGLERYLTHPKLEIVTFNGTTYDLPICALALTGADPATLFKATTRIITENLRPWDFYRAYGVPEPDVNHVDLIEVAPGMVSLKIYGGRLHCQKLQDLPLPPGSSVPPDQREVVKRYCRNDLEVTMQLAQALKGQIDLRRTMSTTYGVDLRSKSDAQIAEAVLRAEVYKLSKKEVVRHGITYRRFCYDPPDYVRFLTPELQAALEAIRGAEFVIKSNGHVEMPPAIEQLRVTVNGSTYAVGIGGLHSQESAVSHYADEHTLLVDRDVVSYYPNLMLNLGMVPEAMGPSFTEVYGNVLKERIAAKHSGDKVKADSLKITLNSTFGKLANQYSTLYNPAMMIRVTLTGQLSLLMLIEWLELKGIPVISANTDGIVIKCPVEKAAVMSKVIAVWEKATHLETEEVRYRSLHSRDVNSYIAIKLDGSVKVKGAYASGGLAKNPQNEICTEAVIKYLVDGVPVEATIRGCQDIRKFLTLRTVKGGAVKAGYELGKAIRWYYALGVDGVIAYKTNGNTVPRTEGAKPLLDLPATFPADVDYRWYEREARSILMDIGVLPRPVVAKIPRKNSKAWHELVAAGKLVERTKGKWTWRDDAD